MKTKYKHIHFEHQTECDALTDKPVYVCRNNRSGGALAQLGWYAPWKQYVAEFNKTAVFSADCLKDIADFMAQF